MFLWHAILTTLLAVSPAQFEDPIQALESLKIFSRDRGSLEVVSESPVELIVTEDFVPGDFQSTILASTMRNAVEVVYRAFAHTATDSITVTAIAMVRKDPADPSTASPVGVSVRIEATRGQAASALRHFLPRATLSSTVTTMKLGDLKIENQWSESFDELFYNESKVSALVERIREERSRN